MSRTSRRYFNYLTESNAKYIIGKLETALRPSGEILRRTKDDLDSLIQTILLYYKKGTESVRLRRTFVKASTILPYCYGYFTIKMKVWVEHILIRFFTERDIYLLTEVVSKLSTLIMRLLGICFHYNKVKGIY